ncbi:MAG: ATP-dependent DNA helicase RecG [Spirochaetes bacterium]|nr:ATP-dependent DNA helicase RecG [Spirochaetota bacterium]
MLLSELNKEIRFIKGVGEARARLFHKLNIYNLFDLLTFYPFRYEDRRNFTKIINLQKGIGQTVLAEVIGYDEFYSSRGRVLKILVSDNTAVLSLICYNRNFLKKILLKGMKVFLFSNKFEYKYRQFQTSEFDFEIFDEKGESNINLHTNRIVPVYHTTEKLSVKMIRKLIFQELEKLREQMDDPLPAYIRKKYKLKDFAVCHYKIHFPSDLKEIEIVRQRLAFDRFFFLELMLALNKHKTVLIEKKQNYIKENTVKGFVQTLPFELTNDQKQVIQEIFGDMKDKKMMNRLLMGDVGSGKTVVGLLASLLACENGYQVCLMAPTEILASQHYQTILQYLKGFSGVPVVLLTGKQKSKEKEEKLKAISNHSGQIIIGTHALIQEDVRFNNLGLVIIDEQHRFGVRQRALLHLKGDTPDVLVMTATPIPRTLALTVYGDLEISMIKEMPPGRKPAVTKWFSQTQMQKVYQLLEEQMRDKKQVYVVYPLVSESDKMDLKNAEGMFQTFKEKVFNDFRVGLIHGQMKKDLKDNTMDEFRQGKIDLLVATTVIEVGVDVANASVMVVEHAERFGLAQLHQLRGRIGRSDIQSYCILITSQRLTNEARMRMRAMVNFNDGFKLAEVDLELRGPGEMMGTRQTGLPDYRPADLIKDTKILQAARKEAFELIDRDPQMQGFPVLEKALKTEFHERLNLVQVG